MAHPLLTEDWSVYDNRKIRDNRDRSKFSCDEQWEVDYLINKLRKHFPFKTDSALRVLLALVAVTSKHHGPEKHLLHVFLKIDFLTIV